MTDRLPLSRYPGMNQLVLDWLGGDERFLRRRGPANGAQSSHRHQRDRDALRSALVESNRQWGIVANETLARWERGESLTIIAGQQVGFAGGPLYTLAKLATLVRIKRDLEKQEIPVTAFFWLATEDHDFDEIAGLNVPVATLPEDRDVDRQLDLHCMRAARTTDSRSVVGSLPVPEALVSQLVSLYDLERPSWLREGITFRDSFAELIAQTFGSEIVLVDALLPELRRSGAALFEQIQSRNAEIQTALVSRSDELQNAGYREQVVARDGEEYTLLFELDDHGVRRPSRPGQPAERTSTSALTRPLLQDFVIEPDIFVGGPAEVAYYAQIAPLHDLLGIAMPRVALRGHALIAPKRMLDTMARYGIDPAAVFTTPEVIIGERESAGVGAIHETAAEARKDLLRHIEQISNLALPADHSLARSIQRSIGHLEYHFDKLAERAVKGLVRKDRERYAAVRKVIATLYPDGHVQDRVTSWFPWWLRYGNDLVSRMIETIEPDSDTCRLVGL